MSVDFTNNTAVNIGSNVAWQGHNQADTKSYVTVTDQNGDTVAESGAQGQRLDYSLEGNYTGTDLGTDLDTFLSTLTLAGYAVTAFGVVWDATAPTRLSLAFHEHTDRETGAPSANGGHTTAPASFDIRDYMPENGPAIGVPVVADPGIPGITAEGDGIKTFSISASIDHVDVQGRSGKHLDGTSRNCRVDMSISGVGAVPTLGARAGHTVNTVTWVEDGDDQGWQLDGNVWTFRGHDFVIRT